VWHGLPQALLMLTVPRRDPNPHSATGSVNSGFQQWPVGYGSEAHYEFIDGPSPPISPFFLSYPFLLNLLSNSYSLFHPSFLFLPSFTIFMPVISCFRFFLFLLPLGTEVD